MIISDTAMLYFKLNVGGMNKTRQLRIEKLRSKKRTMEFNQQTNVSHRLNWYA